MQSVKNPLESESAAGSAKKPRKAMPETPGKRLH